MHSVDEQALRGFNALGQQQAIDELYSCCSSQTWANKVAQARPFADIEAVLAYADHALAEISESDLDEALAGHPRIGDRPDNPSSTREQSGVSSADPAVLDELKSLNGAYEQRFGHVYLVFANGRPAAELLAILKDRMSNTPETERQVMRAELSKINRNRLTRTLATAHENI